MPNHMKMCGCPACKRGMHHYKRSEAIVKKAVRKNRRKAKQALKQGNETNNVIPVPYTD